MTKQEYTPTHDEMHVAWFQHKIAHTSHVAAAAVDAHDEFRRYRAEIERAAAERAYAQGVDRALEITRTKTSIGDGLLTVIGNPYRAALGLTDGGSDE